MDKANRLRHPIGFSIVLLLFAPIPGLAPTAHAGGLYWGGKLGKTTTHNAGAPRVWAVAQGGRFDGVNTFVDPLGWSHLNPTVELSPAGIAAISWDRLIGTTYERGYVFTATADPTNYLLEYSIDNGVHTQTVAIGSEPSSSISGELAVTQDLLSGGYISVIFVSNGQLIEYHGAPGSGVWYRSQHGTPSVPLDGGANVAAASASRFEHNAVAFAARTTNGNLAIHNGENWAYVGNPGVPIRGALAATYVLHSGDPVLLVAAIDATVANRLWIVECRSSWFTTCSWTARTAPALLLAINNSIDIVGNRYADATVTAFGLNGRLFTLSRSFGGWGNVVDRGVPYELINNTGGGVALHDVSSPVYFVARVGSGAHYLAKSTGSYSPTVERWFNIGAPVLDQQVTYTVDPHTESSLAEFQGNLFTASIVHGVPTVGSPNYVETTWSTDDGYSNTAPQRIANVIDGVTFDRQSDPVVDFEGGGLGWLSVLSMKIAAGAACKDYVFDATAVHLMPIANGAWESPPIVVKAHMQRFSGVSPFDHPWLAISKQSWRKYVAWWDLLPGSYGIRMRTYDASRQPTPEVSLSSSGGPPVLTAGAADRVYAGWLLQTSVDRARMMICEVTTTGCVYVPINVCTATGSADCIDTQSAPVNQLPIRVVQNFSLVASPRTSGRVYFAYGAREYSGSNRDIWVMRSDDGGRTWSAPWPADPTVMNDGFDQFYPAITVSGSDHVAVSWYDRRHPYLGRSNYYIHPYYSVSDGGMNFQTIRPAEMTGNWYMDPALLPVHCNLNSYFLGDYHESRGVELHSHMVYSHAPVGSEGHGFLWQRFVSRLGQTSEGL